jgi:hypothetical protein
MKQTLLLITCVLATMTMFAQEETIDYLPFVEKLKSWEVVRTTLGQDKIDYISYVWYGSEEIGGKNYNNVKAFNGRTELESYFLREENRKVYMYDTDNNFEFLVFDYSLKEGDTYETYSYDESKMVTYKVLSVGEFKDGPEVIRYGYDEVADTITISRRYLQKWTVSRIDDVSYQKIWIESAGSLEGPLANLYDSHPYSIRDYLIFVDQNYAEINFAFPFYDTMNNIWRGQSLPHSKDMWDGESRQHKLTYELEGDRLHIYGQVFTIYGGGLYILFKEEQTDDPQTIRIRWQYRHYGASIEQEGFLFTTDFYVPGFDPNKNYIVVDNKGEEHPVINKTPQNEYRQFVEDGKIWIVKVESNGWPKEEWIEYYYFDGDTIIGGQTAKRMMCVKGESLGFGVENIEAVENIKYIGAWYEQDKKVYYAGRNQEQFELFYDFTLSTGDSILMPNHDTWLVEKVSGGIQGFKGTYYEIGDTERWLEGVGSETFPQANFRWNGNIGALIACCVGDEVIYLNEQLLEEQGIDDPDYAKKRRFDFNHTVKTQPKTPNRRWEEVALYGEYNDKSLDIRLDPLDDAYLVRITDKAGQSVYEKAINAGNIVALNIDISEYPEGQYEITIDNSNETFNGVIDTTTGIDEIVNGKSLNSKSIYNLNGQRMKQLQRGLNVVDGKKIYVK